MRRLIISATGIIMLSVRVYAGNLENFFQNIDVNKRARSAQSRPRGEVAVEQHGITEIGLEVAGADARSPVPQYTMLIGSDGRVFFNGTYRAAIGQKRGRITTTQFNRLAQFMKHVGYKDFDSNYEDVAPFSGAVVYTTAVIDGERKVVRNQDNRGPENLWAIEQLITQTLGTVQWDQPAQTPTPTPAPSATTPNANPTARN
jgi:hypothetical protein